MRLSLKPGVEETLRNLGLLLLRLAAGGLMAYGHGVGKLKRLTAETIRFADPIGLGPEVSLALATFAELGCALAVVFGLLTRAAAIPVAFTMLIAAFVVHAGDPLGDREMAILYASAFLALTLTGPGAWSIDRRLFGRR